MIQFKVSRYTAGFAVLAGVLLFVVPAHADEIIWDNGTPNLTGMWPSNECILFDDPNFPDGRRLQSLDNFTLPPVTDSDEPIFITGVHWWGYEILPAGTAEPVSDATFLIHFLFSDASGFDLFSIPSGGVFTGHSMPFENGLEAYLFEYDANVVAITTHSADDNYLIDINSENTCWHWAESDVNGLHYTNVAPGDGGIEDTPGELAFYLRGHYRHPVIREPATLSLLGLGLGGLALRRRQR